MGNYDYLLTKEIAQEICDIFLEETNHHTIMVNKEGIIFASTNKGRIGTFHQTAKQVMDGVISEGIVSTEEENKVKNVKAGINIPILYKGERVANLGIAGDPKEVRPIVKIATRTVQLWLQNQESLHRIKEVVENINSDLHEIMATVEEVTAGAQQVMSSSEMASNIAVESNEKMKQIEEILDMIKKISSQSNLIGLNAAIEAARVGEAGRGFSVVANEVRKLSYSSEESVSKIDDILKGIQKVFNQIVDKINENAEINKEQSKAFQAISDNIFSIEQRMDSLVKKMNQH